MLFPKGGYNSTQTQALMAALSFVLEKNMKQSGEEKEWVHNLK